MVNLPIKDLGDITKSKKLDCWVCDSSKSCVPIDSYWECSRPYKIFMCLACKHTFTKYEDEL